MAMNAKAIKTRIGSVKNTKKITRAMEMVSAAKMRRSIDAAFRARKFAALSLELLHKLSEIEETEYPLLQKRQVGNMLLIVITSNRGLCGSFNANVLRKCDEIYKDKYNLATLRLNEEKYLTPDDTINIDVLGIGKKSAKFAKKHGLSLVGVYDSLSEKVDFEDILPIARFILDSFLEKKYDKIALVYTHYVSSLVQEVKVRQLLPLSFAEAEKIIEKDDNKAPAYSIDTYLFEPSLEMIINTVIPKLIETLLFEGILESNASEHSARMMAMKNASEAAGEMIEELNLTYNKARQAAVTQEIAEIAAGAAAVG